MTHQFSVALRNARCDQYEAVIGTGAALEIRSGAPPADCAAADIGTVLAGIALPADFLSDASDGSKSLQGTWEDTEADADGIAGHFRIKDSGGTCHHQGTVSGSGGGGDMEVLNTSFAVDQPFTITGFTLTKGNP